MVIAFLFRLLAFLICRCRAGSGEIDSSPLRSRCEELFSQFLEAFVARCQEIDLDCFFFRACLRGLGSSSLRIGWMKIDEVRGLVSTG